MTFSFLNKKRVLFLSIILGIGIFLFFVFKESSIEDFIGQNINRSKQSVFRSSIFALDKIAKLLPIENDTKKEIEAIDYFTGKILANDNQTRKYLFLLQNNMELRPGGGFLGQYAIVSIKNGAVVSQFVEDANLLDQRIPSDVDTPYPFEKLMSVKNWKFRDSNFSPDFPTNVQKALYFYKRSGGSDNFDGVIAINSDVLSHILGVTGPISVVGYPGSYTSENAVLKLESQVEKDFEAQGIAVQDRKLILKKLASAIIDQAITIKNVPKLSELILEELRNKNIMLYFKNQEMQSKVAEVFWDGRVAEDWNKDYLMVVDANMGALKSDYYIKRSIEYNIDLTQEKPLVNLFITYNHTATQGDWRTSDYHTYLRVYAPKGAELLERKMVSYPNVGEDFNKTSLGFIAHAIMGQQLKAQITYTLPASVKDNYQLLIEKQSGVGEIPVKIVAKTEQGEQVQETILKKDLKFELKVD